MRMRVVALCVTTLFLASCSDTVSQPPKWSRSAYDWAYERLTGKASHWGCETVENTAYGPVLSSTPNRECYEYAAPRRTWGIYIQEFEGDRFLENAKPAKRYAPTDDVWLSFDRQSDLSRTPQLNRNPGQSTIWAVDFVGRKTAKPARYGYGHMGMSDADVIVDTMLAARRLAVFPGYVPESVLRQPAAR